MNSGWLVVGVASCGGRDNEQRVYSTYKRTIESGRVLVMSWCERARSGYDDYKHLLLSVNVSALAQHQQLHRARGSA